MRVVEQVPGPAIGAKGNPSASLRAVAQQLTGTSRDASCTRPGRRHQRSRLAKTRREMGCSRCAAPGSHEEPPNLIIRMAPATRTLKESHAVLIV